MLHKQEEKRALDIRLIMSSMGLDEKKFEFFQKEKSWPPLQTILEQNLGTGRSGYKMRAEG